VLSRNFLSKAVLVELVLFLNDVKRLGLDDFKTPSSCLVMPFFSAEASKLNWHSGESAPFALTSNLMVFLN
jgi:hypothetical protein